MLLEPGLSMYLPTGTPHAARAQDTVSLHVTIGINQLTWRTLLDRAVRQAMERASRPTPTCRPATSTSPALLADGLGRAAAARSADALADTDAAASPTRRPAPSWRSRNAHLRGSLVDRMHLDSVAGRHHAAPPAGQAVRRCDPTATGCTCSSATAG